MELKVSRNLDKSSGKINRKIVVLIQYEKLIMLITIKLSREIIESKNKMLS